MLSQKNLWPTFTTRGTLTEEVSEQVFSKERRRLQAKHLWMVVKLRWRVLVDRMYVKAPTRKSKEELDALVFDRAARRNRTDPYEEKKYRGAGIKEVQAWWKKCQDWMAHLKEQSEPFVYDFKKLLKALIWLTSNHLTTWRSTTWWKRTFEGLRGARLFHLVSLSLQISLAELPGLVPWPLCGCCLLLVGFCFLLVSFFRGNLISISC